MDESEEPQAGEAPVQPRRSRRNLVVAGALIAALVLAVFLPPLIHLGHYRHSITGSISAALGRPVSVGDMQLRLLPTPGIAMADFTVGEDPAFGYEPALHANAVVASLRLSSLWRGRLEVSRISLDEASLNLVKNSSGQWSFGSVLLRAAQHPNEATGQRYAGLHPRFPYIEATDARINFKQGVEKRPFSLMNAEFSMWQASSGEWQVRLKAQPVRTDRNLHLSDTGELTVEGSLRRAGALRAMPVNLRAVWSGAQLGQVSQLLAGADTGWRGALTVTAAIAGTAGNLALQTRIQIGNLRRQEFQPAAAFDVDGTCQTSYQHAQALWRQMVCFLPEGSGHLLLTGSVHGAFAAGTDLHLEINQVPAEFPLRVLGLMRPRAAAVTSTGAINGAFEWIQGKPRPLTGSATAESVNLAYPGGTLPLPTLHLTASPPPPPTGGRRRARERVARQAKAVELEPVMVDFGAPEPLIVDAGFSHTDFSLHLAGQAAIGRMMAAGANFGFLANVLPQISPKGRLELDTTTAGRWMPPLAGGNSGITTTGVVKVIGIELHPAFLHAPIEIATANLDLTPQSISWQNVAFRFAGMAMRGAIDDPTVCIQPAACPATFALQPGELNAAAVESALAGKRQGFFGQMMADLGEGQQVAWPPLHGTIQIPQLNLGRLALHGVAATVTVAGNALHLDSLDAAALGGSLHARGDVTIVGGTPHWSLDVRWMGVKASETAVLFNERWGTGTANGEARLTMSGYRTADLASSTAGTFQLLWQKGGLSGAPALAHFDRWSADGTIGNRSLTLTDSTVTTGGRNRTVEGTVGFDRHLQLAVDMPGGKEHVGGTLARPTARR